MILDEGRFLSVDPALSGGNWLAFAANNPIMFVDPTGLFTFGDIMGAITGVHDEVATRTAENITRQSSVFTQAYGLSIPGGGRKSDGSTYGYPDISQPSTGKVWEVKHDSVFGFIEGEKQLSRYVSAGQDMEPSVKLGDPVPADVIDKGEYTINIRPGGNSGEAGALALYSINNKDGERVNVFQYAIKELQEKEGLVNSEVEEDLVFAMHEMPGFLKDHPEFQAYTDEFSQAMPGLMKNLKETENPFAEFFHQLGENFQSNMNSLGNSLNNAAESSDSSMLMAPIMQMLPMLAF